MLYFHKVIPVHGAFGGWQSKMMHLGVVRMGEDG